MLLSVRPLPGGLGAEIVGFDFDTHPDRQMVDEIRNALIHHRLLLLRGRPLDPARQIAFTGLFGSTVQTCSPRTRFLPSFPEICRVSNRPEQGHPNIGRYWHSDGAYLSDPTAISIHHIIAATDDGDTLYADLITAYERLSTTERTRLSRMSTRSQTGVVHPLIRPHPVTGRLALYVNMDMNAAIIDESGTEDREIRDFLCRHLDHEDTLYRHKWRNGDLIVADNFAVAHHALPADPAALRVLHRTSIHGPSVWWRSERARRGEAAALMGQTVLANS